MIFFFNFFFNIILFFKVVNIFSLIFFYIIQMSMNWDCSLIMRTSLAQQNSSQLKTTRHNRNETSRDIYIFEKNALKDQNRSAKPKGYQYEKSKQIKKKTSLKNKNCSSSKILNSQAQVQISSKNFTPYVNSLLVSPVCQQNTRPQSKIQTQHTYSKITQFYPQALKSPRQNQYLENYHLPQRINGFCSPNTRQKNTTKNPIPVTNGVYHINYQNNVGSYCQKNPIYTTQYNNKGDKFLMRQFNKIKPTKTCSYLINIKNYGNKNESSNKQNQNKQIKNTIPLFYRNEKNKNLSQNHIKQNQQNLMSINQDSKQSDIQSTLNSIKDPQKYKQIFKQRKRIEDFLKSRQQIKSIRDSDDISQENSQVVATYDDLVKDGVLKMND